MSCGYGLSVVNERHLGRLLQQKLATNVRFFNACVTFTLDFEAI
jgi:hypothetical protein